MSHNLQLQENQVGYQNDRSIKLTGHFLENQLMKSCILIQVKLVIFQEILCNN